ncbi:MAG: hypothetical protein MMC33_002191 [Icmadophila ericetorum]|nr:hypothetical protein [Icmadophila ericetorum]
MTFTPEHWSAAAPRYDQRVGHMDLIAVSRLIDRASTLHPFSPPSSCVLDLGAGTGNVTFDLESRYPSTKIVAVDYSSAMLAAFSKKAAHIPSVTTKNMDAAEIEKEFGPEKFTHVFSTFMLQYTPSPQEVLHQIYTTLKPGGVVALGMWSKNNGPIVVWTETCAEVKAEHQVPHPHEKMAWMEAHELEDALKKEGFTNVESEILPLNFGCKSTADLMKFWYESDNPVPKKLNEAWVTDGGSLEGIRKTHEKVTKERYDDAKAIVIEAVLVTAKK